MANTLFPASSKCLSQDWQAILSIASESCALTPTSAVLAHRTTAPIVVLNIKQVLAVTGMSRSKLYALIDPKGRYFDPSFPPKARIGARSVGFAEHLVQAWLASRFEHAKGGRA